MVRKIAEFLGRSLTEAQISEIVQITRFEVMKQDPAASRSNMKLMQAGKEFMRKGMSSVLILELVFDLIFNLLTVLASSLLSALLDRQLDSLFLKENYYH